MKILAALLLTACSSCTPVAPQPIGPEPAPAPTDVVIVTHDDGGTDPPMDAAKYDSCTKMCVHGRALHCAWGSPTKAGASCEAVCRADRAEPAARLTPKYLACMTTIKACADDVRCPR